MNCTTIPAQPDPKSASRVVRALAKVKLLVGVLKVKNPVQVLRSKVTKAAKCPLYQRLPKRGFNKPNRKAYAVVNLGLIQKFIDAGKLTGDVTEDSLIASGLVRRKLDGVRVLAKGDYSAKVSITVTGASAAAKAAVEAAGGSLTVASSASSE
jgi:ribosomal protein L15